MDYLSLPLKGYLKIPTPFLEWILYPILQMFLAIAVFVLLRLGGYKIRPYGHGWLPTGVLCSKQAAACM